MTASFVNAGENLQFKDLSQIGLAFAGGGLFILNIISYLLILAIAFVIAEPIIGRNRTIKWGIALLYTLLIYYTLPIMPKVWASLANRTGGYINYLGTVITAVFGVAFVAYLIFGQRERRILVYIWSIIIGSVYAFLLVYLSEAPAERLHLVEYGLLSYLVFSALKMDIKDRSVYLWGTLIVGILGAVDEGIQWILPERVFQVKDIGVNLLCGGLGQMLIGLTIRPKRLGG